MSSGGKWRNACGTKGEECLCEGSGGMPVGGKWRNAREREEEEFLLKGSGGMHVMWEGSGGMSM
jgi:hypothetical protein